MTPSERYAKIAARAQGASQSENPDMTIQHDWDPSKPTFCRFRVEPRGLDRFYIAFTAREIAIGMSDEQWVSGILEKIRRRLNTLKPVQESNPACGKH